MQAKPNQGLTATERSGAHVLLEKLAVFAKSCILYPDASQRVRDQGEQVLQALREGYGERRVQVSLRLEHLSIDDEDVTLDVPQLEWLHDFLFRSGVGALRLFPARLAVEGMVATVRALSRASNHRATGDPLPVVDVDGIELVEQRVDGVHSADHDGDADGDREISPSLVAGMLAQKPRVRSLLEELKKRLAGAGLRDEADDTGDVVMQITDCLPVAALRDPDFASILVAKVLSSLNEDIERYMRGGGDWCGLADLVRETSRRFFRPLEDGPHQKLPHGGVGGHGDDRIVDDLHELQRDLDDLERDKFADRAPSPEEVPTAEIVGVMLHHLLQSVPARAPRLQRRLRPLIDDESPAVADVVRSYLDAAMSKQLPPEGAQRVIDLLEKDKLVTVVEHTGLLDFDDAVRTFPDSMPFLLDSLGVGSKGGADILGRVCEAVGRERLRESRSWFVDNVERLNDDRVQRLVANVTLSALPLVGALLATQLPDVKSVVARSLRNLGVEGPATVALRVVQPPSRLPRDYLVQLVQALGAGPDKMPVELVRMSGTITRNYIVELDGMPGAEDRRVFAIMALRELPCAETRVLLKTLLKARKSLVFFKESKAVRRAASEVMRWM